MALINTFFTSNNAILTPTTHTHFFYTFNQKKAIKNRYTRKQLTHFFKAPSNPNQKKNFFQNLKILKLSMPKKMTLKSQAKKHFQPFFNLKKVP